jgi:hypothetical protein
MKVHINIKRSAKDKQWLGFVGGKLIPLVHIKEGGVTAENVYSVAAGIYPRLKLDQKLVDLALEMLCENDFARCEYKKCSDDDSTARVRHYLLTSKGASLLAVQFMSNNPDIAVEIMD